jgi:hypothetical protein
MATNLDLTFGHRVGFGKVIGRTKRDYIFRCSRCGTMYRRTKIAVHRGHSGRGGSIYYCGSPTCIPPGWLSKISSLRRSMLSRCYNQKNNSYSRYGGRGIDVCLEWRESLCTFIEFAITHGWQPNLEIDRENNDLGYSPGNVRFVTRKINCQNKASNKRIEYQGKSLPVAAWAEQFNLPSRIVYRRINASWPIERALTQPVNRKLGRQKPKMIQTRPRLLTTHHQMPSITQRPRLQLHH